MSILNGIPALVFALLRVCGSMVQWRPKRAAITEDIDWDTGEYSSPVTMGSDYPWNGHVAR